MKKTFCFVFLSFMLANCGNPTMGPVGVCCDTTYIDVGSAINCLNRTVDGNGISYDERLLLLAFVNKDLKSNQKLGWDIINDPDIVKTAKRKYALVILDTDQYKILNHDCSHNVAETMKNAHDNTIFVIANQALCVFGDWTLDDEKAQIIDKLQVGNGP